MITHVNVYIRLLIGYWILNYNNKHDARRVMVYKFNLKHCA